MDIASLVEVKKNLKIPDITPGDTVKVSARIVEGGKERIQVFQGVIIKVRRGGAAASFTVRHVAYGIGVERTFLFSSPLVEKVEIVRHGKVRRARLYYLRGLSGKEARRQIKRVDIRAKKPGEEVLEAEPEEEIELVAEEEPEVVSEIVTEEASDTIAGEEPEAATAEQPSLDTGEEKVEEQVAEQAPQAVTEEKVEKPVAEQTQEEVARETMEAVVEEPEAKLEEPKEEESAGEPEDDKAQEKENKEP
jgi:large subunit ribosomal protein L19